MNSRTAVKSMFAILLIVYNVIIFEIPVEHTKSFWISYAFCLFAFADVYAVGLLREKLNDPCSFFNYSLSVCSAGYLLTDFILTGAVLSFQSAVWQTVITFIIPAAAFMILILGIVISRNHVRNVESGGDRSDG